MLDKEYIIWRQKQWEKKWAREREEMALEEAVRIAKMEAEAHKQEEIAARKKRLLEQQEAERLRQKHIQRKEKLAEQKWNKQFDTLLAQIENHGQKDDRLEEVRAIIQNREPVLEKFDWAAWLTNPLNQKLADLDFEYAMEMFKRDNLMAKRRHRTRGHKKIANYFLSFTGDTQATARADMVRTDFTPNDPTNKGFAEDSGRIPLAKSGFTISYWYRPDETANDAFAMGWKRENTARFSFGMRNAARPYFGIGSNTFGTYGSHNAWYNMFNDSGNTDLTDKYIDGSNNLIADEGNWYHIVITFVGSEPGGTAVDAGERYRRIYFNGKQIYGYNSEAIGTAYEDYHNVDRKGELTWTAHLNSQMTRGLAFGMRALKVNESMADGTKKSKYNNGHACGLDEVAIYNELKDNDWIRDVYSRGTKYSHKSSGGDGLVAYWRFNEGNGTTVKDLGPYGWHGTLTNAAVGEGDDITVQTAIGNIAEGVPTFEFRDWEVK